MRRGAYEPAAEQLEKALRADPSFHRARFNLGEILVRLGRTNEGIDAMRIAVEGMPANITARFSLAAALDQVGRPFDALSEYDAVLRIRPDHVDARVRRAIALSKTGGTDAAAAALVEVIQRHPDRIDAHANLALLLARAERHAQAADAFRAGLAQAPNDAFMTERLAWLLATCPDDCCRDGEEALALAQRLCTGRGAENPRFLDTLAAAEAETGDYESAITTATRAAELLEMLAGRRHATPGGGMPNPTEMAERVRKRIADYRSDKPYRDTQASERDP